MRTRNKFISAYFDTTTGGKREAESYSKIALELGIAPDTILFVSDVVTELEAAHAAGMQTALSIRDGNAPIREAHSHRTVRSFDDIDRAAAI